MTKTALITGASKGLGLTLAHFFADQNFDLILTARTQSDLDAAAQTLTHADQKVLALAGDVADPAHQAALAEAAKSVHGLDVLINNASTLGPRPMPAMHNFSSAALAQVFETNVLAPVGLAQHTLPLLARRNGIVVNISSDAAVGGYEGWGGYGASKAALDLISRTQAAELSERGIAVISVDPGDMRTDMHQAAFPDEDISDRPLPEITLPFWAWLFGQEPNDVTGRRFQAQAERWLSPEPV
jgi:NAD(P)-dependent dehydrogenase (short-subunit alcohol dehydrogenase family)